jgi:hypothetical protein
MSYDAKIAVSSWWILVLMALFLWYRNIKYDRALAIFVFTLGLIQLIEYGIYSGADPNQSGRALYITLWLQCLVLAIGVYMFINSTISNETQSMTKTAIHTIAGWNLFLFSVVFVIFLVISFSPDMHMSVSIGKNEEIIWYKNGGSILGNWTWLYLIGIFLPLFLLLGYYMWADLGIAILIIYGILTTLFITANYYVSSFGNLWYYLSVGFAFLAWFLGILPSFKSI